MLENTPPQPLQFEDDLEIPVGERKTVATLLAEDCRWPFGDPTQNDFHFCGRPHADGSPYCAFHMRRAFQTARPRGAVLKLRIA